MSSSFLPTKAILYKAGVEFYEGQKLQLRVSRVPTEFGWVDRDIEGNLIPPKLGDVVVSQTTEDIMLADNYYLPQGSKFYGRVVDLNEPKHFLRDGNIGLEFYKIEVNHNEIELGEDAFSFNTDPGPSVKSKLGKLGTVGAYAVGGTLAGAYLTFAIGGVALASNPYVIGGAAGAGAAFGLASGIFKKGKLYDLEPGTELDLTLNNTWLLKLEENGMLNTAMAHMKDSINSKDYKLKHDPKIKSQELSLKQPVDLEVLKVKKSKTAFGTKALAVTLNFKNNSKEELRYSSFKLVDSMGKEYEPSPHKLDDSLFGSLSKEGQLKLYYAVEFLKAPHTLKVVKRFNQEALSEIDVLLN